LSRKKEGMVLSHPFLKKNANCAYLCSLKCLDSFLEENEIFEYRYDIILIKRREV